MAVTGEAIRNAKALILPIGRIYEGIDYNLNFDNILDADKADDIDHPYQTTGPLPSAGAVPTYVSAYFPEGATKPRIAFGRIGAHPFGSIRPKVIARTLTLEEATAYLWWFAGRLEGTPTEAWASYGVTICPANTRMTGQEIFHIEDELNMDAIIASDLEGEPRQHLWLAIVCAASFRLHGSLRPDYRRDVAAKITAYLNTLVREDGFDLLEFVGDKGQWEQDKKYSKVIAGIDMFLMRFPSDDYSRLRLCTIGARYKDCAALVGVEYLRNLLNVDFGEIFMWIWTKGVPEDMRRVFKKGEEITTMHSYLPYVSSMKLAERSPYSATVNPSLHYFVHFCGCSDGSSKIPKCQDCRGR